LPATVFLRKFVVVFTVGIFIPIVFDIFVVKFKVLFEITTFPLSTFMVDFKFPFICESNSDFEGVIDNEEPYQSPHLND
jgi:hypothetical protein